MNLDDLLQSDDILGDLKGASDDDLAALVGESRNNRMKPKAKPRKGRTGSVSSGKGKKKTPSLQKRVSEMSAEEAKQALLALGIKI